jgi:transcriptional regulator with XRE-family HTH domain
MAVRLQHTACQNLKLKLAAERDGIPPTVDGGSIHTKRPSKGGLGAVVRDGLLLCHDGIGLTCLTHHVKHNQPMRAYSEGMDTSDISTRIAQRMAELGMTQAELARRCHIDRSAVNQWLNGSVKNIRPENLVALADALGLEIRWIITGRGPRLAKQDPPMNWDDNDRELLNAPSEIKQIFHKILESTRQKHP